MNCGFSASCGGLDKKVPKHFMQFSRCLVDMHLNHISQSDVQLFAIQPVNTL